ncbi:Receptor-type tyrosine-protein phosphatase epsilon [Acipenser ruthenus]|uniref:protein-tyrosine-phosphatase n=1 Tax=Acipenser ruthenus TaxID=7906 RepID=A0A444ULE9_ACIRT|nr:Receptor-type tyrosine-protein phosphatase epsilon [Acipenser ruthenus]
MMDPFHVPLLASSLFLSALTTMTLAQNNTGSNSTSNNLIKTQEDNAGELSTPCSQEQQTVMLLTRSPSASKKYFPIPVDCLEEEYRIRSADDGKLFREEFNSLPNGYTQGTCEEANREDNKEKNRYPNILPYDHSRVILTQIDGNPCSDYINASYIDDKCDQYWPDQGCWTYGNVRVVVEDFTILVDYTIRKFCVQYQTSEGSKAPRLITQLHFTSWPDFGVPFTPIGMLKFLKKVKTVNPSFAGPIVVHCSAGVGRTGTFIVIDAMIDMMHAEQKVDVFALVSRIREQRSQLVQTDMQYSFIYQALLEYYLYGDTELDVSSLEGHLQKLHNTMAPFDRIGLEEEFKKLTNVRIMKENMRMGNLPANMKKNRVLQIIPYDFNRVILSMKRGQENTDYINASFIDGYRQKDYFIATQGPLSQTVDDFWRMVWEWKSHSIVMLTELQEREQDKCFQYWPSEGSVTHGDWTVEIKGDARCDTCSVRDFMLSFSPEKQTRLVRQFHFHGWPEIGIPADGKGMIDIIAAVQKQQQQSGNHPIIVHCRKPDCDIRIQLPHVSKEHCKIEVNENKEVIVTNLSTVNPTRLNGKIVHQSESLKDRDVITIIDRSFRFEYPPELTPKKRRLSASAKNETLQVLHLQQVKDTVCLSPGNQRQSTTLTSDASYDLKEAKAIATELLSEAHIKNATPGKKNASDTEFAHNHRGNQEKLLEGTKKTSCKKRRSGELQEKLVEPPLKRKRVSFAGHLSPELFDKRLPPDSPLRKGAMPTRLSLSVGSKGPSVLRRVSTIGIKYSLIKEFSEDKPSPNKKASPKKTPSKPNTLSPDKKSPKLIAKTLSPAKSVTKTPSPGRKSLSGAAKTPTLTSLTASSDRKSPNVADVEPSPGWKSPTSAAKTPSLARSVAKTTSPVARSWADIVKLGAAKTQRMVFAKKQATKAKKVTIKKVTSKMPKTPAQKIKGHFSTGHADSPMTIVVGRAHARAVKPAGQVPKLVRNLALMKRSMEMNESFTGIAEMFSTPVNEKPRRTRRSSASTEVVCSTPVSLTDASVLNTPEETGEMVVSPLSAPSTTRRGRYNKDAVTRLLQEKESSYSVVKTPTKEIIAPIDLSGGSQQLNNHLQGDLVGEIVKYLYCLDP